eukprot:7979430-Alexandrium_andersonii.AAC.1
MRTRGHIGTPRHGHTVTLADGHAQAPLHSDAGIHIHGYTCTCARECNTLACAYTFASTCIVS